MTHLKRTNALAWAKRATTSSKRRELWRRRSNMWWSPGGRAATRAAPVPGSSGQVHRPSQRWRRPLRSPLGISASTITARCTKVDGTARATPRVLTCARASPDPARRDAHLMLPRALSSAHTRDGSAPPVPRNFKRLHPRALNTQVIKMMTRN